MKRDELIEAMARAIMVSDGCGCNIGGKRVFCDDEGMPADTRYETSNCACKQGAQAALTALEAALSINLTAIAEGRTYVVDGGTLRDAVSCLRQNAQHMANTMDSPRANWMNNSADHLARAMLAARSAPHDQ